MSTASGQMGLIVVLDEVVSEALGRLAVRRGWPILRALTAGHAIEAVRQRRVDLVVVQVSVFVEVAVEVLARLHAGPRRVRVAVVALRHDEHIERAMRAAGADCYLVGWEPADRIERTIEAMDSGRREPRPSSAANDVASGLRNGLRKFQRTSKGEWR